MFWKIQAWIFVFLLQILFQEISLSQSSNKNQSYSDYLMRNTAEKFNNYVTNLEKKISLENSNLTTPVNYGNNNSNNRWVSIGPFGGDVKSLAMSNIDTNIIYAGTGDGGIYKSENSGLTWNFLQFSNSWVHHIVIHPDNDSILFAVALLENDYGVIAKTTDGGKSWGITKPVFPFFCVTMDRNNPDICYGGGGGAIYKSTNGGELWIYSGLAGKLVYDIAVSPLNSVKVFALTYPVLGDTTSLYISNDSGFSWILTQFPLEEVNVVTPDYSDSLIVYIGASQFYKSTDGGYTWNSKSLNDNIYDIEIDPNEPNIIYASTPLNIYKSIDKGETWEGIGIERKFFSQSVVVNPQNSNTILTGTFTYGIFKTYDMGNNWFETNKGLDNVRLRDIEIDPVDPKVIYVAADGAGVYKSIDGGNTWEIKDNGLEYPFDTWGLSIAVNPHNNNEVYFGTLWTITTADWSAFKSTDKGESWLRLYNVHRNWVNSIAVDLEKPNSVYAATNAGFMFSNDGGQSWTYSYPNDIDPSLYAFVIDPNNPHIFYVSNWYSSLGIFKSTNKGLDWNQKNNGINLSDIPYVKALAIDNSNSSILFTGTFNKIYKTTDSGNHWNEVFEFDSPSETMALLVSYKNPSYVYAGTLYSGMFVSYDGGINWSDFDNGFYYRNTRIYSLGSSPAEAHIIYAATMNHSLYKYVDSTLVRVEDVEKLPIKYFLSQNYPNPFNPSTNIQYAVSSPASGTGRQFVSLKVYDILGNEVTTLVNEEKLAGEYKVEFQSSVGNRQLASGIYFYSLRINDFFKVKKMLLLK